MKIIITAIFLILTGQYALMSQHISDSLLFDNMEEWNLLKNYNSNNLLLCMALTSSQDSTIEDAKMTIKQINKEAEDLANRFSRKSVKKKVKIINKYIHDNLLKRYKEECFFTETILTGNYNCVTASAIYSAFLTKNQIENVIVASNNHVFVIADPQKERILVEGTLPQDGLSEVKRADIEKVGKELTKNKIVEKDFKEDDIFRKYMIADSIIETKALIALEYYNMAIDELNDESYKSALYLSERARIVSDLPFVNELSLNLLLHCLFESSDELTAKEYGMFLSRFLNFNEKILRESDNIRNMFIEHATGDVRRRNSFERIDSIASELDSLEIISSAQNLLEDIKYYICLLRSEYYYNNLDNNSAYRSLYGCYSNDKFQNKVFLKRIITAYILELSGEERYLEVKKLRNRFDFLNMDATFLNEQALYHSRRIYESFNNGEKEKGWQYIDDFNKDFSEEELKNISTEILGNIYGWASSYYVRILDYKKAKEILDEALKKYPESKELQRKRSLLNEY